MRRPLIAGFVLVGAFLLCFFSFSARRVRAGLGSVVPLRSEDDLLSLRQLLTNQRTGLDSFAPGGLSLWTVTTDSAALEPGDVCVPSGPDTDGKIRHRLEFGGRYRRSSRVYAVSYLSCHTGQGQYESEVESEGFGGNFNPVADPVFTGSDSLRVWTLALEDDLIFDALSAALQSLHIGYMRLTDLGYNQTSEEREFLFVAADVDPQQDPTATVFTYRGTFTADLSSGGFVVE
jgi:hypothetical protein